MIRRSADGGLMARPEARGFITHLFAYVTVNLLLVIVNLRTTPNVLWFQWPLLGWGLGLVVHGLLIGTGRATPPAAARPAGAAALQPVLGLAGGGVGVGGERVLEQEHRLVGLARLRQQARHLRAEPRAQGEAEAERRLVVVARLEGQQYPRQRHRERSTFTATRQCRVRPAGR